DYRGMSPRFSDENLSANRELVARIEELAREKDVTAGQLALAWVMAQGEDVVPIPGTKRRSYLEQNAAATEIELSADERERLSAAVPPGSVAGERYADMRTINR
ncbi:MAG TPA: aldo/keto reductase, partial [Solirubrobacteraceae bacterium]|nr:aldo/keto reductase [Solirubrobacteraceae bacterium]